MPLFVRAHSVAPPTPPVPAIHSKNPNVTEPVVVNASIIAFPFVEPAHKSILLLPLNCFTINVSPLAGGPIVNGPLMVIGPDPIEIVAYGLEMLPVIEMPFAPTALRTSAPFNWLLMKLRNHVGSQSFGMFSVVVLLIPGFD